MTECILLNHIEYLMLSSQTCLICILDFFIYLIIVISVINVYLIYYYFCSSNGWGLGGRGPRGKYQKMEGQSFSSELHLYVSVNISHFGVILILVWVKQLHSEESSSKWTLLLVINGQKALWTSNRTRW